MSSERPEDVGFPDNYWPADGRLGRLHGIAVARRIACGELPLAAALHAIAEVVRCATAAERAEMLAADHRSEEGAQ
jgi:hypothetical protein